MTVRSNDFGTSTTTISDPAAEPSALLQRLLEQAESYPARVARAARCLRVEVDGVVIASSPAGETRSFDLQPQARSLTLRDENGAARAHVLLQEQELEGASFDRGRIVLSLRKGQPGKAGVQLVVQQAKQTQPQPEAP